MAEGAEWFEKEAEKLMAEKSREARGRRISNSEINDGGRYFQHKGKKRDHEILEQARKGCARGEDIYSEGEPTRLGDCVHGRTAIFLPPFIFCLFQKLSMAEEA